ncbi:MAG: twin-arginine translocase TatA/TatE family subunit [Candidatus Bathyarchaeia archaeon]
MDIQDHLPPLRAYILILLIVVLIFGASRLPAIGKGLGEAITNFKASMKAGQKENEQKKLGSSATEKDTQN